MTSVTKKLYRFYAVKRYSFLWQSLQSLFVDMDPVQEETNELRDPSFSYQLNNAHYKNFQVLLDTKGPFLHENASIRCKIST